MAKNYDEKSIQVLDFPDNVRAQMGMYIGAADETGIYQIFKEILDNSIDETRECGLKRAKQICISFDGKYFIVQDWGRGVPVGKHAKTGESTLTTVFTKLHAGGKSAVGGYGGGTVGVHGVGAAVTNALAKSLEVKTFRDGKWYGQKFERGIAKTGVKQTKGPGKVFTHPVQKSGTWVKFEPDMSLFTLEKQNGVAYGFSLDRLLTRLEQVACFIPGTTFRINYCGTDHKISSPNGLSDLINIYCKSSKTKPIGPVFSYQDKKVGCSFTWTELDDEIIETFVSSSYTEFGGTHKNEFLAVLADSIRNTASRNGANGIPPRYFRLGLVAALDVRVPQPKFDSQTKSRLVSREGATLVRRIAGNLSDFLSKNKGLVRTLVERAKRIEQAEANFKLSSKAAAKINGPRGKTALPKKLLTSSVRDPEERELFILEGDSAGGTAKMARDPKYQEVLALRGKFTNVYKGKDDSIFNDESILSVFQAVGFNPSAKPGQRLKNRRVGKIFFLADADDDGFHINALLISLFAKFMPSLFKEGRIFIVKAPLYQARIGDKKIFAPSMKQMQRKIGKKRGVTITRLKGHGETNPEDLARYAFNPNTRKLIQLDPLTPQDRERIEQVIGKDGKVRKILLGLEEE